MKNLILVFMTLVSLCSYSQRDLTKIPYYFFFNFRDSISYQIDRVFFNAKRENPQLTDKVENVTDKIKYHYDKGAIVFDLNKDWEYMIRIDYKGQTTLIHTYTENIEPKYFPSINLDFTKDEFIELIYNEENEYYLSERMPFQGFD